MDIIDIKLIVAIQVITLFVGTVAVLFAPMRIAEFFFVQSRVQVIVLACSIAAIYVIMPLLTWWMKL
jgi:hypothetical protein